MASIFHLNTENFGGISASRNAAFTNAFAQINASCSTDLIAAGFTEITNWKRPLRKSLLNLSSVLDPGLTKVTVAEVGTMGMGKVEYIGMTWDPTYFDVDYAGQVLYDNLQRSWVANVVHAPIPTKIPANVGSFTAADQRGPAFLAGKYNGDELIVMFMHNMYILGDITLGFNGMSSAANEIQSTIGNPYDDALVIAGGDYNISPRNAGSTRQRSSGGTVNVMYYRAATAGGTFVNTTAANPYDFWLVSDPSYSGLATVHTQTRIPKGSDHAAIRLVIP